MSPSEIFARAREDIDGWLSSRASTLAVLGSQLDAAPMASGPWDFRGWRAGPSGLPQGPHVKILKIIEQSTNDMSSMIIRFIRLSTNIIV